MNKPTPFTDEYLRQVYEDAPLLRDINEAYKDLSLYGYLEHLKIAYTDRNEPGIDPVIESAVRDYATALIGEKDTESCIEVLRRTGFFHTADHHVVNFHAMSFQGNLLFEYLINMSFESAAVPFFSCSSISMSNAFYPRGIIIYDTPEGSQRSIPLFPYRMRKVTVSQTKPFTADMLEKAASEISRLRSSGGMSDEAARAALEIIDNAYSDSDVLKCQTYGQQITLTNRILSERYFTDRSSRQIFLELEEVSMRVICHDLEDEESFLYKTLFNGAVLDLIRENLDGVSGCWTGDLGGTFLFWGVDEKKRLYRLNGEFEQSGLIASIRFYGTDLDGNEHSFSLDRSSLIEALRSYQLIPGLFVTFFALAIARDVTLWGGCYQGRYVRSMCQGIRDAWQKAVTDIDGRTLDWLYSFDKKRFPYLTGPLYLFEKNSASYHPLGSVEMWVDPISRKEYRQKLDISFTDAQKLGLYCFYPDSIPPHKRADDWWNHVSTELLPR